MSERLPRLLIVDDEPVNVRVLAAILRNHGDCQFATGGVKALEMAAAHQPDLILLDVEMPDLDGYAVCERLKADPATRDIPVIFVTGRDQIADEERGLMLGAIDYISKPMSAPIIRTRVLNHLALARYRKKFEALKWQDGLTGLAKRPHFEARLTREWSRALHTSGAVGLALVEVDRFRAYNDTWGYMAGDRCLQGIARALTERFDDASGLVARFDADDFVVLLTGQRAADTQRIAGEIVQLVRGLELLADDGHTRAPVTVSVGAASLAPDRAHTADALVEAVEAALRRAKDAGRDQAAA